MTRWHGEDYDRRFKDLEAQGHDVHGEAMFVESLGPQTVLDAGCGTGRVAIELARRGLSVVGVDCDASMLEVARRNGPAIEWELADLATVDLGRTFDAVVMAGNVVIFLTPGTEEQVMGNMARHVAPAGVLITGFSLRAPMGWYDDLMGHCGLRLVERWATWDRDPWADGGDYAVSVWSA